MQTPPPPKKSQVLCIHWRIKAPVLGATWRRLTCQGTPKTKNSTDLAHNYLGWAKINFRKKCPIWRQHPVSAISWDSAEIFAILNLIHKIPKTDLLATPVTYYNIHIGKKSSIAVKKSYRSTVFCGGKTGHFVSLGGRGPKCPLPWIRQCSHSFHHVIIGTRTP